MLLRVETSPRKRQFRQGIFGGAKKRQKGIRSQGIRQRNHHERRNGTKMPFIRNQNDAYHEAPASAWDSRAVRRGKLHLLLVWVVQWERFAEIDYQERVSAGNEDAVHCVPDFGGVELHALEKCDSSGSQAGEHYLQGRIGQTWFFVWL